jgi:1,4-alpha-glucan branching enzyme
MLAGSFNDWRKSEMPMHRTPEGWRLSVNLSGGKHHYKFIVDGNWIIDPENPIQEWDRDGNLNSVILIQ